MHKRLGTALLGVVLAAAASQAQDMPATLQASAGALGMLRGMQLTDSIASLQYEGVGLMVVSGKPMRVLRYRATVGYGEPAMRVDADVSDGGAPDRQIHVVRANLAWNERDKPGGPATPAPETQADRLLQIWMTPHGAIKAARAAAAGAKITMQGERSIVTFSLPAPLTATTLTVTLDEKRFPERVHARTGTTEIENIYSGYKDWDLSDIYFPSRIVQKRGGQTVFDLTVTDCLCTNPYAVFPIPGHVAAPSRSASQQR